MLNNNIMVNGTPKKILQTTSLMNSTLTKCLILHVAILTWMLLLATFLQVNTYL